MHAALLALVFIGQRFDCGNKNIQIPFLSQKNPTAVFD